MFIVKKMIIFNCGFFTNLTCALQERKKMLLELSILSFNLEKLPYFSYFSRVLMLIGHCHLCMECHLKLRLQSLKMIKQFWPVVNLSIGLCKVHIKIGPGSAVLTFIGYKQTDKQSIYLEETLRHFFPNSCLKTV